MKFRIQNNSFKNICIFHCFFFRLRLTTAWQQLNDCLMTAWWLLVLPLVQNYFGLSKSFWSITKFLDGPICFGLVKIILIRSKLYIKISREKSNLNLIKIIWTWPKRFGHNQNNLYLPQINLYLSKTICTCPKWFGRSKIILHQ